MFPSAGRLHRLISVVPQTEASRPLRRRRSNTFRRTTNLAKNLTSLIPAKPICSCTPRIPPKNVFIFLFGQLHLEECGVEWNHRHRPKPFGGCSPGLSGESGNHAAAASAHPQSSFPPGLGGRCARDPAHKAARLRARGGGGHL